MKTAEIKQLGDEQLVHRELELERQMVGLTFRQKTGQLEDPSRLGKLRKDIARVRTEERARERAQNLNKDSLRDRYRGSFRAGAAAESAPGSGAGKGFLQGLVDKIKGSE